MVHQVSHAVGEQLFIQAQLSVLATAIPIAVIDVHILVASLLQSCVVHSISLLQNQLLVNIQCEGVP